jgi:23S rRNA (adenine2503-C2)-methyltransferase
MKISILEKTLSELVQLLKENYGKGIFHAEAIYRQVFKSGSCGFTSNQAFEKSGDFAARLENDIKLILPEIVMRETGEDGALKFVSRFEDGACVESVVIPMSDYKTLCVSTQVGCRMGCRFCETGRYGLTRNLSASEIVAQVFMARFHLGENIRNLVFMGMGEPLDNFDNLVHAITILNEQKGLDFAHSRMTVSTAGLPDGLRKLGEKGWRRLHVAVSLNAPNDKIRSWLMPVNNHAPMARLKKALEEYPLRPGGCFLVEYIVIPEINNLPEHAAEIAGFIGRIPARINLIPCNQSSGGEFRTPEDDEIHKFAELLTQHGLFVRKRWSRGSYVSAGCGQLGAELNKDRFLKKA